MTKKLTRDPDHQMLAGVIAGFANYFKHDVTVWRVAIVVLAILTGVLPVVVFYIASWFVMPEKDRVEYTVVE